jgi:hypothetical protein
MDCSSPAVVPQHKSDGKAHVGVIFEYYSHTISMPIGSISALYELHLNMRCWNC